jgi:hypothetical protein
METTFLFISNLVGATFMPKATSRVAETLRKILPPAILESFPPERFLRFRLSSGRILTAKLANKIVSHWKPGKKAFQWQHMAAARRRNRQ